METYNKQAINKTASPSVGIIITIIIFLLIIFGTFIAFDMEAEHTGYNYVLHGGFKDSNAVGATANNTKEIADYTELLLSAITGFGMILSIIGLMILYQLSSIKTAIRRQNSDRLTKDDN